MSKIVLVCGDRNWTDSDSIRSWLAKLQDWGYDTLVEGEARGADRIAAFEARRMGFTILPFPAKWKQFGIAAGSIRNQQMIDEGHPELVVYFHHDLTNSKGTKDMVRRAEILGIEVLKGEV